MAKHSVPHHQAGLPPELYWVRILTHIMSESDATALDSTETSNIGDGAESAGGGGGGGEEGPRRDR